jgi:outer membrane protein
MKKLILIIGGVACFTLASAQNTLSLKDCIQTALDNNLNVKRQAIQVQSSTVTLQQSRNNKLPIVNGNYGFGVNNGRSIDPFTNGYINQQLLSSNVGVGANVLIYNGLRLQNTIRQNTIAHEADKTDAAQIKEDITLNVLLAYLQVLNNEDLLALAQTQVAVTQKQITRLEVLNKQGAIAPSILYDMKAQRAADELSVNQAANAVSIAKLNLLQWMNQPYEKDVILSRNDLEIPPSVQSLSAKAIYEEAIKNRAIVKAAQLRREAAAIGVKIAEAGLYPTVGVFSQLGTNYSSAAKNAQNESINYPNQLFNNLNSFVGLSVQVPIFNAFSTKTRVQQAKLQVENAAALSENIKWQLRQDIERALLNLQNTESNQQILAQQVEALNQSFRVAESRFTQGVINSVDFLIVKNNLDRAQANLLNAHYDRQLRALILSFYQQ